MDLSSPTPTTSSPLIPVFGDNVQDLLGTGTLQVNPSAIITVNSIADTVDDPSSGVITLRDAINQANADNGEDLIVFERSLFSNQQTITLGGTELDITHNLNIIAPRDPLTGENFLTLSGNKASRIFEIEFGSTVSIEGLIVANGDAGNDNGGGIKNFGTLALDNSIVRNNSAAGLANAVVAQGGEGGGIYNTGTLTVSNSTISSNLASLRSDAYGGGIYNMGTAIVLNSTLDSNSAVGVLGAHGGGIFNAGNLLLSTSTLSNNSTGSKSVGDSYGGGIENNGTVNVSNSTINGNRAAFGGGIENNGTLEVSNSTISGNSSGLPGGGGGIENNGTVNVNNSTISGNRGAYGGGIRNGGTLEVSNSTISGNSAYIYGGEGGGIYNTGRVNVGNSTISGNSAYFNGGGITNNRGILNVSNTTFSGNSAGNGGGGIFNGKSTYGSGGTVNVSNSTISGNTANNGGGIYGDGSITDSTISSNSASISGGGIYGSGNITNSTINGNTANNGGGIYGSGNITNSTITGNRASSVGGGIYNSNNGNENNPGTLTLLFSTVTQNEAANGGGVYGIFNVTIRNTIIANNLLTEDGINPDVFGTFISYGYNLIGDSTGSTGFSEGLADIVGTSDSPIDPRLAPLDFYGGSTQTFALLRDSPAIDADPTVLLSDPTTDQRGFPRVVNGRADLGAFEFSS